MRGWLNAIALTALFVLGCDTGDIDDPDPNAPDAAAGQGADAAPVSGEPAELMGITNAHNSVRATVGVGPMEWDNDLAAVAQAWANSCTDNEPPMGLIDHNAGRSDNYPGYVGENVYGSSGNASGLDAVSAWAGEEADYDYDTNSCGGVCGHYTQIVWADSIRLGCAYSECQQLQFGSTVVCNYSPGGNSGGRPY